MKREVKDMTDINRTAVHSSNFFSALPGVPPRPALPGVPPPYYNSRKSRKTKCQEKNRYDNSSLIYYLIIKCCMALWSLHMALYKVFDVLFSVRSARPASAQARVQSYHRHLQVIMLFL